MEKEIIKATINQIEDFKNSLLWQDIQDELKRLYASAGLEYDIVGETYKDNEGYKVVPNSSETLIHLGDIKGRRKAVKYFLSIPDILLQTLEDGKDDSGREQTD